MTGKNQTEGSIGSLRRKVYVVDTSVLIEEPDIFYKLCGNSDVVVPTAAIKEIDGLKRSIDPEDRRAKAARKVARTLDNFGNLGDISKGVGTPVGSRVRVYPWHIAINDLASNADNRIVGAALRISREEGSNVTLLSTDLNMRNVARSRGLKADNYPSYLAPINKPKDLNSMKSLTAAHKAVPERKNASGKAGRKMQHSHHGLNRALVIAVLVLILFFLWTAR